MPTDEERREVAARLRNTLSTIGTIWSMSDALKDAVFDDSEQHDYYAAAEAIADLIEPEPERTCEMEYISHVYRCSACGWQGDSWRVTGVTDDGSDYMLGQAMPSYCPNCGARVVGE